MLSLLSLPEASHWLLNSLLKIRLLEISNRLWWRAGEKYGKFQLYSESTAGSGERGSLSIFQCVWEREAVCEWLLILLFSLLSHAVRQSGHSVQQLFHSGLTFQDLVGTARSLVPATPLFCPPLATLIPSPHPIRFRKHTWNTFSFSTS